MLATARCSIAAGLAGTAFTSTGVSPALTVPRGVFVTLHRGKSVRGCIGFPFSSEPLHQAVAQAAVGAALQDPRFPPVSRLELPEISITLSVLSPMFFINVEQILIGTHGIMVTLGSARGLLLPQIAVEHGWTPLEFLESACLKAGLPRDVWKVAQLEAFTAETFSEDSNQEAEKAPPAGGA